MPMSPDQKFHPQFDDPEAEIIISSKEGTLFRVHSAILKSASDLLRLFLSRPSIAAATEASTHFESFAPAKHLPSALSAGGWRERQKAREAAAAADKGGGWGDSRPKRSEPATSFMEDAAPRNEGKLDDTSADVITVPFFDKPLERVLLIISAKPIPPWQSFAELEAAMEVMDYLDTPGPISYIRYWCLTPVFLSEPIRLYGLGARYGWEDVMQHASKLTLSLNLFPTPPSPNTPTDAQVSEPQDVEGRLSRLPGNALYRLLRLHHRRRDEFRLFILDTANFPGGTAETWLCNCGRSNNNTEWRLLCSRLIRTMDQDVSGEKILLEMESWPESTQFWKAYCSRCHNVQASKLDTLTKLRNCINQLLQTI